MKINGDFAEFIGIILGDGYIHKMNDTVVISGSLQDFDYYTLHVLPLIKRVFGKDGIIYFQKNHGTCYLAVNSKNVISLLLKVGLKRGKKGYALPKSIMRKKLYPYILRGIFDTDGCLKFSKQTKEIPYYPRIQITLMPSPISLLVRRMLRELKFDFGEWEEENNRMFINGSKLVYFHVSGVANLEKWMRLVGMKNPVHINKYKFWEKYGFYSKEKFNANLNMDFKESKNINSPIV